MRAEAGRSTIRQSGIAQSGGEMLGALLALAVLASPAHQQKDRYEAAVEELDAREQARYDAAADRLFDSPGAKDDRLAEAVARMAEEDRLRGAEAARREFTERAALAGAASVAAFLLGLLVWRVTVSRRRLAAFFRSGWGRLFAVAWVAWAGWLVVRAVDDDEFYGERAFFCVVYGLAAPPLVAWVVAWVVRGFRSATPTSAPPADEP